MKFRALQWDYHNEAALVEIKNEERRRSTKQSSLDIPAVTRNGSRGDNGSKSMPTEPSPPKRSSKPEDTHRQNGIVPPTHISIASQVLTGLNRVNRIFLLTNFAGGPQVVCGGENITASSFSFARLRPDFLHLNKTRSFFPWSNRNIQSIHANSLETISGYFTCSDTLTGRFYAILNRVNRFRLLADSPNNDFRSIFICSSARGLDIRQDNTQVLQPRSFSPVQDVADPEGGPPTQDKPPAARSCFSKQQPLLVPPFIERIGTVVDSQDLAWSAPIVNKVPQEDPAVDKQIDQTKEGSLVGSLNDSHDSYWKMRQNLFPDDDASFTIVEQTASPQDTRSNDQQEHAKQKRRGKCKSDIIDSTTDALNGVESDHTENDVTPSPLKKARVSISEDVPQVQTYDRLEHEGVIAFTNTKGTSSKRRKTKDKKRKSKKKRRKKETAVQAEQAGIDTKEMGSQESRQFLCDGRLQITRTDSFIPTGGTQSSRAFFEHWMDRDHELRKTREDNSLARSKMDRGDNTLLKGPLRIVTASKNKFRPTKAGSFRRQSKSPGLTGITSLRSSIPRPEPFQNNSISRAGNQANHLGDAYRSKLEDTQSGDHLAAQIYNERVTPSVVGKERRLFEMTFQHSEILSETSHSHSGSKAFKDREMSLPSRDLRANSTQTLRTTAAKPIQSLNQNPTITGRDNYSKKAKPPYEGFTASRQLNRAMDLSRGAGQPRDYGNTRDSIGYPHLKVTQRGNPPLTQNDIVGNVQRVRSSECGTQNPLSSQARRSSGHGLPNILPQSLEQNSLRADVQNLRMFGSSERTLKDELDSLVRRDVLPASEFTTGIQAEPTEPPLKVFCAEKFLVSRPDILGALASRYWIFQKDNTTGTTLQGRRIALVDTSFVDQCFVDIELNAQSAILLCPISKLEDEGTSKEAILRIARLSASRRYNEIFVILVLDVAKSNRKRKALLQLETATICQKTIPPASTKIIPVQPKLLPDAIAKIILESQKQQKSQTDPLPVIPTHQKWRVEFLLDLIPTFSYRGAIQCIVNAAELRDGSWSGFPGLFLSERVRQELSFQATSTPSRAPDMSAVSMVQLSAVTCACTV